MQASRSVLRVALPVPLPRPFDYLPPPGVEAAAVAIGQRILVPFGGREMNGIVIGHGEAEPGIEPKPALALPDPAPLLQGELFASLQWLAGYLHAPLGEVLSTALPAALRRGEAVPETAELAAYVETAFMEFQALPVAEAEPEPAPVVAKKAAAKKAPAKKPVAKATTTPRASPARKRAAAG